LDPPAVIWNHDPKDWAIDNKTWFESDVKSEIESFNFFALRDLPLHTDFVSSSEDIETFVNGPKTPGLLMLEHELSEGSAGGSFLFLLRAVIPSLSTRLTTPYIPLH